MKTRKLYASILVFLTLFVINSFDISETYAINEITEIENEIKGISRSSGVRQATENSNIVHNFQSVCSATIGNSSDDYPRGINIGYPHPDGVLRIIVGSSQFTNHSIQHNS